jgi:hypothetical protein
MLSSTFLLDMTEEDPDDLAAAFYAAQAAKNEQLSKLPTDDWVNAITTSLSTYCLQSSSHDGNTTTYDSISHTNNDGIINDAPSIHEWLVTEIPNLPSVDQGEIKLNTGDCFCRVLPKKHHGTQPEEKDVARNDAGFDRDTVREKMKQSLVEKLLEEV